MSQQLLLLTLNELLHWKPMVDEQKTIVNIYLHSLMVVKVGRERERETFVRRRVGRGEL